MDTPDPNPDGRGQQWAFTHGEGDRWFERNRAALGGDSPVSPATALFTRHVTAGDRVLEVGCANGGRLHQLVRDTGCRGWGLDPSVAAVTDGRTRFPELHLCAATADALPFAPARFDVVVYGFCLYLVERARLGAVVAACRRVLAPGGFAMIHDFDPPRPIERPYHHLAGVTSFKEDHSAAFTGTGDFVLVDKRSFSHAGDAFHPDPDERVGAWVLHHEPR